MPGCLARVGLDRHPIWRWFSDPGNRTKFPAEDWATHSRTYVADPRATAARRHGDPDVVDAAGDRSLVVLFARPGTDTRDKLDLLRVIGTQAMTIAPSSGLRTQEGFSRALSMLSPRSVGRMASTSSWLRFAPPRDAAMAAGPQRGR